MATIGTLAVNIVATTDKFISGLNNASGRLGKFVKSVGVVQGALAGLAATGFAAVIKGAIDAGGALFDLSQKLNTSTEALGALHFAANQLGGSAGAVNTAISFLQKTLGKAAEGSDAAQASFSRLGIDFRQLIDLSGDQQFLAVVDALNKIPNAAGRASAGAAVLGKQSKELAAAIAAGTDEIIKFGDAAARNGAILTTEQAAALDETSDSIAAFSQQWQTMTQAFVSFFSPIISGSMTIITESIKFLHSAWNTLQFALLGGAAAVEGAMLLVVKAINAVLPKAMEFSGIQQELEVGMDSLLQEAKIIGKRVDARHGIGGGGPLEKATLSGGPVQTDKQLRDKIKLDRKMEGIQTKEDIAKQRASDKLVREQLRSMKAANQLAEREASTKRRMERAGINQQAGLQVAGLQSQKSRLQATNSFGDKDVAKNTAQQVKQLDVLISEIRHQQKLKVAGVR